MSIRTWIGAAVVGASVATLALPAAAADSNPRMTVAKQKGGPYEHDEASRTIHPGEKKAFFVKVKNSKQPGEMRLEGSNGAPGDITFRYFKGKHEITNAVVSPEGKVLHYGNKPRTFKVEARVAPDTDFGHIMRTVSITDVSEPIDSDAVALTVSTGL